MKHSSWRISEFYKASIQNHLCLLNTLEYKKYALYCGLSAVDSYRVTDAADCMHTKEALFYALCREEMPPGIPGALSSYEKKLISGICRDYLLSRSADESVMEEMSFPTLLAYGEAMLSPAEKPLFRGMVATLSLSSLCAHISAPPLRLACMHFTPERLAAVGGEIPTLREMCGKSGKNEDVTTKKDLILWFSMSRPEDALYLMELGDAMLLFCEEGKGINDYTFALHMVDEACTLHERKKRLSKGAEPVTFGENRFEVPGEEILARILL